MITFPRDLDIFWLSSPADGKIENHNKKFLDLSAVNALQIREVSFFSLFEEDFEFKSGQDYKTIMKPKTGEKFEVHLICEKIKKGNSNKFLITIEKL